jgi:hypothetical protein
MLMPDSGITFVRRGYGAQDCFQIHRTTGAIHMRLDRFFTRLSFGIAAVAIVAGISYTLEYAPVLNALAR